MKIGILGSRGIPNRYGGFEQFAEHLATGLAKKGEDVWVYCSGSHPHRHETWKGVNLIYCHDPVDIIGTAGQFVYDLNCVIDSRKRDFDIIYQLGYTSNSIWHRLLPKKTTVVTNMDGLEWTRSKYSVTAQAFLKYAEKLAVKSSHILISDSMAIKKYLEQKYRAASKFIAYGADVFENPDKDVLHQFKLAPFQYYLVIARLQPDNHLEETIQGVLQSISDKPLVIIGNTKNRFGRYLQKKYRHPQIQFMGSIFDKGLLNNLRYFSALYFHGHSAGGTNPSLLEAMACSSVICAHNNAFNSEVIQQNGYFFTKPMEISKIIETQQLNTGYHHFAHENLKIIRNRYNWAHIIESYHNLFTENS